MTILPAPSNDSPNHAPSGAAGDVQNACPGACPSAQRGHPVDDCERLGMLQAGLDLLDQGLTVFDADLRLVAWNEAFLRLLDFPPEMAYVGAPFDSFIRHNALQGEYGPGDVERQVRERVEAAAGFKPHTTERVRPNGRVLQMRGAPLPGKGFVTLYTDITAQRDIEGLTQHQNIELEARVLRRTAELKKANAELSRVNDENAQIAAALRRSEARLRLINDNMPALIGYIDKHETYQYANKGYSDWFGVPAGQVIGSKIPDVIGPDVYAQVKHHVQLALGGKRLTYEYHMERQGQLVTARSTMVPEIAPDGEVLGFFVLSHDITGQKQMQAALVQAQKMEAVGQLTGGLAHDFNNLLTVIIGTLVALRDQRADAAEVDEYIEPALQSARRGAQLIKRLLTFSRQQPLEPVSVEIGRLIGEMSKLVRRSLPDSIAVTTDLPDAAIHCMVDPGQLESALLNFVLNARDAMAQGGHLRVALKAVELGCDAAAFDVPPGAYAMIEVSDTGCGMDAATLARAHEPFFTTKRAGLGSGLGLSMAHGLLRQSGGGMSMQSRPGEGATVRLVLPITAPDAEVDHPQDDVALHHGEELVLLVEDEPDVRRVVRQQLIDLGYPVIEAANAAQALEMIEYIPDITIVLSDVVMSGSVDGRELGLLILENRPLIRVLLMSAYSESLPEAWPKQLPLLPKPFSQHDLARALLAAKQGKS
jgi:PAS domain S-box-containing protein